MAMQHVFLVCESHLPDFHLSLPSSGVKSAILFLAVLSPLFGAEVSVLSCASCVLHNREL